MTRFRIGITTNLKAFRCSSCFITGAGAGVAAAGAASPEESAAVPVGLGGGGLLVRGLVLSDSISASRFDANCAMSLPLTSGSRERPNCAGRPVTFSEVWMETSVLPATSAGVRVACTCADAVPAPRVSLPVASIAIVWFAWSLSVNLAVPL